MDASRSSFAAESRSAACDALTVPASNAPKSASSQTFVKESNSMQPSGSVSRSSLSSVTLHESASTSKGSLEAVDKLEEQQSISVPAIRSSSIRAAIAAQNEGHAVSGSRRALDLCIVMDTTGSMGPWLEQAKARMMELGPHIEKEFQRLLPGKDIVFRSSFVSYKDFGDNGHLQFCGFSEEGAPVGEMLKAVKAAGGGDYAEDVAGALDTAVKFDWQNANRVLIHVLDAPPHGQEYHRMGKANDDYYAGPLPHGVELKKVIRQMAEKRIDYTMVRCGHTQSEQMHTSMYADVCLGIYNDVIAKMKAEGVRGRLPFFRDLSLTTANATDYFELIVTSSMGTVRRASKLKESTDRFSKAVVRQSDM